MSEKRKYRTFTPEQKPEIVLAGLRGDRTVREVCREHEISETLYYQWRDQLLEGGKAALATPRTRTPEPPTSRGAEEADRAARAGAGSQDLRAGDRGGTLAGLGVSVRVARSRELVATGRRPAVVARVVQDLAGRRSTGTDAADGPQRRVRAGRGPGRRRRSSRSPKANQTDGNRMVAALAAQRARRGGEPQAGAAGDARAQAAPAPPRRSDRRRRPGFFRVERPDELWHLDMTKVWVAEHGWVYLHAIVDCCTREIVGWHLELRCRADEAIALRRSARSSLAASRPGELTLGTDNGSPFTSRDFRSTCRRAGSPTAAAATATPSPRRSSSPGSGSSRSAAPGEPSARPSTRPERRSPPTSTATTTGPTPGSATAPPPRSPTPGETRRDLQTEAT